jgi:hypothetical protein
VWIEVLRRTFRTVGGHRLQPTIHWLPRLDASILKVKAGACIEA